MNDAIPPLPPRPASPQSWPLIWWAIIAASLLVIILLAILLRPHPRTITTCSVIRGDAVAQGADPTETTDITVTCR